MSTYKDTTFATKAQRKSAADANKVFTSIVNILYGNHNILNSFKTFGDKFFLKCHPITLNIFRSENLLQKPTIKTKKFQTYKFTTIPLIRVP